MSLVSLEEFSDICSGYGSGAIVVSVEKTVDTIQT